MQTLYYNQLHEKLDALTDLPSKNLLAILYFLGLMVFVQWLVLKELATLNLARLVSNVQKRFQELTDVDEFTSLVIPDKTQYRIFFSNASTARASTKGIIAVRRGEGYEFGDTLGIRANATDSTVVAGETFVLHGDFDGYVYRQEQGNEFDGNTIVGKYRSPDLTMGDAGIRKNFQRVIINYAPEGCRERRFVFAIRL